MSVFDGFLFIASVAGGFVGSVSGFGIGSLVTPVLSSVVDIKLAVAIVSIPHFAGTAIRFWTLRHQVNRRVLLTFGVASAAGGVAGAFLYQAAGNPVLTALFATLLILAGLLGLFGWSNRSRFGRAGAWIAGALSGIFGGMVGNQGGIRSAAMLGFDLGPREFIATATAVALMVDLGRLPVYLFSEWEQLRDSRHEIGISLAGVVMGTAVGLAVLRRISERRFRTVVAGIVLLLGVYMLTRI